MSPDPTHLRLPAGTVLAELREGVEHPVRLARETFVDATPSGDGRWRFTSAGRTFICQAPEDAVRSVDAALVTNRQVEPPIGRRPYMAGLVGSRLVESDDEGLTWRFWTGD